jgi:hypothetical protein
MAEDVDIPILPFFHQVILGDANGPDHSPAKSTVVVDRNDHVCTLQITKMRYQTFSDVILMRQFQDLLYLLIDR